MADNPALAIQVVLCRATAERLKEQLARAAALAAGNQGATEAATDAAWHLAQLVACIDDIY